MSEDEFGRLKFVASIFKMAMEEFSNVMGPESIQTIFRLMGERVGERVEKRMKKKFKIDKWTPEFFAEKFVKDVFEPAIGEGQVEIKINKNELIVYIKICPFQKAGIDISNKFYCTYTEGLIETAARNALKNISFKSEHIKATGEKNCVFKIQIT